MRRRGLALCAGLLVSRVAAGDAPGGSDPAAALAAAREAERSGLPERERAACLAVVDLDPSGGAARTCRERLAWIAARTDPDGGLRGLTALERARRNPEGRAAALDSLAADAGVSPVVRAEAAIAAASAALREGRVDEALSRLAPWPDAGGLPDAVGERLLRLRARALVAEGRVDQAWAVEGPLLETRPGEVDALARRRRDARLLPVATAVGLTWVIPAVPLSLRGWARPGRPRPVGLLPIAVVGGGGLLLSWMWEPSVAAGFSALLVLLAALFLLAAGAQLALQGAGAWLRHGFRIGGVVATVALSAALLQGFGLLPWVGL